MGQLIQKCKHKKLRNEKIAGYLRYLLSYFNLQFGYMNTKSFHLSARIDFGVRYSSISSELSFKYSLLCCVVMADIILIIILSKKK